MLEQVKQALVESAKEVCRSVKVGGKNPKGMRWYRVVKAAVVRNETAWKEVLEARGCKTKIYGREQKESQ